MFHTTTPILCLDTRKAYKFVLSMFKNKFEQCFVTWKKTLKGLSGEKKGCQTMYQSICLTLGCGHGFAGKQPLS
jgi:hypothetical protein